MLHQRTRLLVLAVVAQLCLLPANGSAKQKHRGISQCQQRVAEKVRADYSHSQGTSFHSDVQRNPLGKNAVTISGRGRFRNSKGKKRGFTYSCVYNHRNGKLSKVKYSLH